MPDLISLTAYDIADRFRGMKEVPGAASNVHILSMLRLDVSSVENDAVPWCSAFANYVAWLLGLPRSRSLAARSWLKVGRDVLASPDLTPERGFDVVVIKRGLGPQPGPEVTSGAPGHVGFFDRFEGDRVLILGGNQGDAVSVAPFPRADVLGIRRLYP